MACPSCVAISLCSRTPILSRLAWRIFRRSRVSWSVSTWRSVFQSLCLVWQDARAALCHFQEAFYPLVFPCLLFDRPGGHWSSIGSFPECSFSLSVCSMDRWETAVCFGLCPSTPLSLPFVPFPFSCELRSRVGVRDHPTCRRRSRRNAEVVAVPRAPCRTVVADPRLGKSKLRGKMQCIRRNRFSSASPYRAKWRRRIARCGSGILESLAHKTTRSCPMRADKTNNREIPARSGCSPDQVA